MSHTMFEKKVSLQHNNIAVNTNASSEMRFKRLHCCKWSLYSHSPGMHLSGMVRRMIHLANLMEIIFGDPWISSIQ